MSLVCSFRAEWHEGLASFDHGQQRSNDGSLIEPVRAMGGGDGPNPVWWRRSAGVANLGNAYRL
jgi:hypothetical protein